MHMSCCGTDCDLCNASIANRTNDDNLRVQTAIEWSELYNHPMQPKDINCTGCRAEGAKIGHCAVCTIRACCLKKGMKHCGTCPQQPCDILENFFSILPEADATANRKRLREQK